MPQAARRARLGGGKAPAGPGVLGRDGARTSKRGAPWLGGRLEEEPPQRLVCRRCGLRKRHQDDGHRDAADLTAHVEQRTASDSNPGGRLPAGLRASAMTFLRIVIPLYLFV